MAKIARIKTIQIELKLLKCPKCYNYKNIIINNELCICNNCNKKFDIVYDYSFKSNIIDNINGNYLKDLII